MTQFSILDLVPITEGRTAGDALMNSLDLAQHAEQWGYTRYWVAEHHNLAGVASSATAVVIGHLAAATKKIRVGAGGVMLPNHAPLIIAEQFGTLAALYPNRIDLGLGRAPGTDPLTARALRRSLTHADDFPRDVLELQSYLATPTSAQKVFAVPGAGTHVPLWILGSSLYGAQLAAALGLPFAFASHFAPDHLLDAIKIYRAQFKPSEQLQAPYVALGFNVYAADSDEQADYWRSSALQAFVSLRKGQPIQLPPPQANFAEQLTAAELAIVQAISRCSAVGSKTRVTEQIEVFLKLTQADELILVCSMYEHQQRLHSLRLASEIMREDFA